MGCVTCLVAGAGTLGLYEPADRGGLAELTGRLLLRGTAGLSAEALSEELDFLGATLAVSTDTENTWLNGRCLAEHLPRLLEIMAGSLTAPLLAEDEFIKERNRQLEQVKAIKDEPDDVIELYARRTYFGDHPLGRPGLGTESSLPAIGHTDVRQFYRRHVRPDRCILAIVGHFDPAPLAARLMATLGAWRAPETPAPELGLPALPALPAGPVCLLVDKPEATQANFMLVAPGFPLGDAVEPAAEVMNTILADGSRHGSTPSCGSARPHLRRPQRIRVLARRRNPAGRVLHLQRCHRRGADLTLEPLRKARRQALPTPRPPAPDVHPGPVPAAARGRRRQGRRTRGSRGLPPGLRPLFGSSNVRIRHNRRGQRRGDKTPARLRLRPGGRARPTRSGNN